VPLDRRRPAPFVASAAHGWASRRVPRAPASLPCSMHGHRGCRTACIRVRSSCVGLESRPAASKIKTPRRTFRCWLPRQIDTAPGRVIGYLHNSAQLWLASRTTILPHRRHAAAVPQVKCQFQLNIFTTSISFVDLLYMFLSALPISPSRQARGLGLANM
jgi:hypothetical protein